MNSRHQAMQDDDERVAAGYSHLWRREVGARAGTSFGLGFAIRANPVYSWVPGAVGSFSWAGKWGTYFWIDPAEKLIGIQMIQAAPGKARAALPILAINHLAYGALTIAEPPSFVPPAVPTIPSPEALADDVGTYDFGGSVSSRDRQGLADGKTGWLGIGAFVAMEQERGPEDQQAGPWRPRNQGRREGGRSHH
jgi:hypothetical protein